MKHLKLFEAQNPTPSVSSKYAYLYPVDPLDKLDLVFTAKKIPSAMTILEMRLEHWELQRLILVGKRI